MKHGVQSQVFPELDEAVVEVEVDIDVELELEVEVGVDVDVEPDVEVEVEVDVEVEVEVDAEVELRLVDAPPVELTVVEVPVVLEEPTLPLPPVLFVEDPLDRLCPVEAVVLLPPLPPAPFPPGNAHIPCTHSWVAIHTWQAAPAAPQSVAEGLWQTPLASQQPVQLSGPHLDEHAASGIAHPRSARAGSERSDAVMNGPPKCRPRCLKSSRGERRRKLSPRCGGDGP